MAFLHRRFAGPNSGSLFPSTAISAYSWASYRAFSGMRHNLSAIDCRVSDLPLGNRIGNYPKLELYSFPSLPSSSSLFRRVFHRFPFASDIDGIHTPALYFTGRPVIKFKYSYTNIILQTIIIPRCVLYPSTLHQEMGTNLRNLKSGIN
jgi:hypothetical protein